MTEPAVRTPSRAYVIWLVGLVAYAVAIFHRASLGVAGIEAQERFSAGASAISLFLVLQLAVYAGLQVPVGVLLDRFGSRRMIVAGAVTMAVGQLVLALADSVPTAVAARVLVGAGDAMTFISVLRLVPLWFPGRTVPVVTQLTGILGQVGQIVAAYPLVALLHTAGWTPTFLGAAAVSVLVGILVLVALRDAPPGTPAPTVADMATVRANLAAAWREPGTRIGLYTHLVTQFSGTVFALLWGYPFLTVGQGLAPGTAAGLLTLLVLVGMAFGPLLGRLVGQWPLRRSNLVFGILTVTAVVWTVVLLWPGPAPMWLLVVLVVVLGTNGPGSMIGFDYARTENPVERSGSATGFVNVGGFFASLCTVLAIGFVLDAMTPGSSTDYSLDAFRAAFAVQYVFWAIGLVGVLTHRRQLRARMARDGVVLVPLVTAVSARLRGTSAYSRPDERPDGPPADR
ncbi:MULTISPECIES: MFS transporter [unclassified Modestobacter]|uniref:MFS transporter n=1 Tax=unclassified Modestobacter TaxID=2643866 RepID=UPI0022AAF871|nr:MULTISPECIES: MFS transporter [unclassified Modestobacter]MCZ2814064.1 MFS transporter [Modestobacter sp. VKM Ac-2979]MCZ2844520.1 MFS transporter [Modestobacter sp. VKM Ac-2980]MCZ2848910.1 MFS transporter [Modestobacter sp. VKM Ac-2978]